MAWSASPRNTAVANNTSLSATIALTFTVTSTVAGDFAVIAFGTRLSLAGGPTVTIAGSQWYLGANINQSTDTLAVWYCPAILAGQSSITLTSVANVGVSLEAVGVYACFDPTAGSFPISPPIGPTEFSNNSASVPSAGNPFASISTSTPQTHELCTWAGLEITTGVGTPTGWTSLGTTSSTSLQIGAASKLATTSSTTSSGATGAASGPQEQIISAFPVPPGPDPYSVPSGQAVKRAVFW